MFYFPADTAGLEPATSHYADIVVNAAGALPFKSYASCDSFLAGESDPGTDRRPLLTAEISVFGVAQTPTAYLRERRLLLTLESPSGLSATGSSLTSRLLELALLLGGCLTISGRLEGRLMVVIGIHHGVSPPPRRSIGYRQGSLTIFQTMLLCEAWSGLDTIYGVKSRAALSIKRLL